MKKLLQDRYFQNDETEWEQIVDRVVDNICIDNADTIRDLLYKRVFLPNSPALVNAGTRNKGVMACFVVGPDDDTLEHHVSTLGDIAAVAKAGGGCGFSATNIRPKNSPVAGSAHGYAYGPNAWAVKVSDYLDMITQGGFRSMALMYSMRSDHPDLDEFISLKRVDDEKFVCNFNQSIMATHSWMMAARHPDSIPGKQFTQVAENAWRNGEPGLLFYDTINSGIYHKCGCPDIETTNPCGEQPLPSYGSCNLGSINIAHDKFYDDKGNFLLDELRFVASEMVPFLDDIGLYNRFPNKSFEDWYEKHRPIGIGIMGYADALLKLKMRYGSPEATKFLSDIMKCIFTSAVDASTLLGQSRGIPEHCVSSGVNRRNITLVSVAPTGSIALIAGCSHGIEPIFSPVFSRIDERGNTYNFTHEYKDEDFFSSAINDYDESKVVTWKEHIDTQIAAQSYCDSGVSKTVNMPELATVKDVKDAMMYAWLNKCKGITVYRNNSRKEQVLTDMSCPTGICAL